ncbi:MAG: hypothetical protein KDC53_06210, partial [Saprospiraceae bacterium]|nr:hypothetical protein [Saprospiraceae bacterium]
EEIVSLEVFDRRGLRIYHTSHLTANTEAPDFSKIMMEAIAPQIYIYQIIIKFRQGFQRTVTGDFMLLK